MTLIIQRRQRARDLTNVLKSVSDPQGRRWRVVALDGVGPRLNDYELLKTLDNGAVLHVERWGDAWLDLAGATPPTAGQALTQTVAITVEAEDGPVVHANSDGSVPLWRGQGTRLTANWTISLAGFSRAWKPIDAAPGFSLDMTDPALTTPADISNGGGARLRASARGYVYAETVADAAGGSDVLSLAGGLRSGSAPPLPFYYLPERRRDAIRFSMTATEGVQNAPATYAVRQWGEFSRDIPARTVLAVVRRNHSQAVAALLEGPTGATHHLRYASGGMSYGSATATAFMNGRALSRSVPEEDWAILAVRFDASLPWRFLNGIDAADGNARAQDVRELHLIDAALSDADIQHWMGYAAHRHDLAWTLPCDHPYRYGPPGFETPDVDPTPLPETIRFGRLTRAGHGGWPLPYGGAHVLGGADAAAFAVVEGMMVPAADGLPNATYNLTVDGASLTVETDAGVAHVRSGDEMITAEQALRGASVTLRWREGRFGRVTNSGSFRIQAGTTLTIDAEFPRRTVFTMFSISGDSESNSPGTLVVQGLRAHDDDSRSSIMAVRQSGEVIVRDCEAHGDWIDPTTDFYQVYHDRGGAYAVQGRDLGMLELSEAHNINVCGSVSSTSGESVNRYNFAYGRFGDGWTANAGGSSAGRRWVHDNLYRDSYGRVEYYSKPHTDVLQMRLPGSVDSVAAPQNLPPAESLITVQRNIVWQSLENLTNGGSVRRGERGIYIEGSNGNYGQHSGLVSANIFFGRHETGIDANGNNSEALVAVDNSLVAPDGGSVAIATPRIQDRNVAHRIADSSIFRTSIYADAVDGLVEIEGQAQADYFMRPDRFAGMGPHEIIAALTPRAGGPLDLGDGRTIGAITLDGSLKPLLTTFPPARPEAPPVLALDGMQIDVTLTADPQTGGAPVIRRDLRVGPTSDINNGSEDNWETFEDVESGVNITADSPGDPNYARWRAVTTAGPGAWSMPSAPVTPPSVTGVGWTPASVMRVAHFDASAIGALTKSADVVTAVGDLAGGGALIASGTPSHGSGRILNGIPVFDSPNNVHFSASGLTLPQDHMIAMVFAIDSIAGANDAIFNIGGIGTDDARYQLYASGTAKFQGRCRLSNFGLSNSTPTGVAFPGGLDVPSGWTFVVGEFSRSSGAMSWYPAGSLLAGVRHLLPALTDPDSGDILEAQPFPQNELHIWRDDGSSQPAGAWAEFVMVQGVRTSTRRRLEGYIAHKWGLTALLPADHPYKNDAP